MPKLEIEISHELLSKLQRLAEKEGKPIAAVTATELRLALDRQLSHLDYPLVEVLIDAVQELRTPLSSVIGFSDILASEEANETAHRELLVILRSGQKILRSANNLLDLLKIERGQIAIQLNELDVLALLQEVTARFEIHFHLLSSLPLIRADGSRLSQAVEICITSFLYSNDIVLSAGCDGSSVIITLELPGLVPLQIENYERQYEFLLARYLINAHHGTLALDNNPQGELGMTITLPMNAESAHAEAGN